MPENVNPTEEQLEILSRVKNTTDNLMIKALAGTGKTSTIVMAEAVSTIKPILYLVFNLYTACPSGLLSSLLNGVCVCDSFRFDNLLNVFFRFTQQFVGIY